MIIDGTPKTSIGNGFQIHANFGITTNETPNILHTKEQDPIALVLRLVGYISSVIKYTKQKVEVAAPPANM